MCATLFWQMSLVSVHAAASLSLVLPAYHVLNLYYASIWLILHDLAYSTSNLSLASINSVVRTVQQYECSSVLSQRS